MKSVLGLFAALTLCSCAILKPGCLVQNEGTKIVSNVIVSELQCTNSAKVQSDVLALFQKLDICPATPIGGPVADAVCPAVSAFATKFLAEDVVPVAWGCSSADAKVALQAAILKACSKLPLAPHK